MRSMMNFLSHFPLNFSQMRALQQLTLVHFQRSYFRQCHGLHLLSVNRSPCPPQPVKTCIRYKSEAPDTRIKLYALNKQFLGEVLKVDARARAREEGLVLMKMEKDKKKIKSFKLVTREDRDEASREKRRIKEFRLKTKTEGSDLERKIEQMKEFLEQGKVVHMQIDRRRRKITEEHIQKVNEVANKVTKALKDHSVQSKLLKGSDEEIASQVWFFHPKEKEKEEFKVD